MDIEGLYSILRIHKMKKLFSYRGIIMKKILFFVAALFVVITTASYSQWSLQVQDPQNQWKYAQGDIDSVLLVVRPMGLYALYDMYINFSARSSQYTKPTDTLEVQYYFQLDKRAIVVDSWLWVEDTLVKAKLTDRWTANQIYENIVKRTRRDPSIFYKNSDVQYEFRIYPMAGHRQRRVKISWFEPITWGTTQASIPLPFKMISLSRTDPNVRIITTLENGFKNPQISFSSTFNYVKDEIYGESYQTEFKNVKALSAQNTQYFIKYDNPMQDGVFLNAFKESEDEGYFQLAFLPQLAVNISESRKIIFAIDFDATSTTVKFQNLIQNILDKAVNSLSHKDSFNIIVNEFEPKMMFNSWQSCTNVELNQAFSRIDENSVTKFTMLSFILKRAAEFARSTKSENVKVISISSSTNYGSPEAANVFIKEISKGEGEAPQFYFVDFSTTAPTFKVNNISYRGNEYLYYNMAKMFKGEYIKSLQPLDVMLQKAFEATDITFLGYDFNVALTDGFTWAKYNLNDTKANLTMTQPILIVGKYAGSQDFTVNFNGLYKSNQSKPFHRNLSVKTYDQTFATNKKLWLGNYIQYLETLLNTNLIVTEIVETSMKNRILSKYTAFLALEPWMMGDDQGSSNDQKDLGGSTSVEKGNDYTIELSPNPFVNSLKVSVQLENANELLSSIEVYNIQGSKVYQFDIPPMTNALKIDWNGCDYTGKQLPNGVYLIVIKTTNSVKTVKVILNR